MAKKKEQSLTERLASLTSRVTEKPEPTPGYMKGELVQCGILAEALEEGAVIRDLEAKVAVLEAALEESNLQNSNLQAELEALKAEVEGFRAERKKQEEKKKREEMPDIQFQILKGLPIEGDGATLKGISSRANVELTEAVVHLGKLEEAGFAKSSIYDRFNVRLKVWHRAMPGNELILAKHLAGEIMPQKRFADLPKIEENILEMLKRGELHEDIIHIRLDAIGPHLSIEKTVHILRSVKGKGFINYDPEEATYGQRHAWFIMDAGTDYLAERDKL